MIEVHTHIYILILGVPGENQINCNMCDMGLLSYLCWADGLVLPEFELQHPTDKLRKPWVKRTQTLNN